MANELAKVPSPYLMEVESLENEIAASKYAAKLRHEEEAQQQLMRAQQAKQNEQRRVEKFTTGALQCVTSVGGGALSTVKWGRVPIGAILNSLLGTVGAGVTLQDSERPVVRVAAQSIQTLLHNQIAITTRDIIRGMP